MKEQGSNGWKLFGWILILIVIYGLIFCLIWNMRAPIGMLELDTQIEHSIPADVSLQAFINSDNSREKMFPFSRQGKNIMPIKKKEVFLGIISSGRIVVILGFKKNGVSRYVLNKDYYYVPKKGNMVFLFRDIYNFKKVRWWKRSCVIKITPNYVEYANLIYIPDFYR